MQREKGKFDFTQLFYFVTDADVAAELGKKESELDYSDLAKVLGTGDGGLGLDSQTDIFHLPFEPDKDTERMGTWARFVPLSALERVNAPGVPEWNSWNIREDLHQQRLAEKRARRRGGVEKNTEISRR